MFYETSKNDNVVRTGYSDCCLPRFITSTAAMKLLLLMVFSILFINFAMAQPGQGLGIGVIVGEPTGISFKSWKGPSPAIAGAVAWSFSGKTSLHVHIDYLMGHNFLDQRSRVPLYYGLGGRVRIKDNGDSDPLIGVRIPVGISYIFPNDPFDIFLEIAPIIDVIPDTDFGLNSAIGARYYF